MLGFWLQLLLDYKRDPRIKNIILGGKRFLTRKMKLIRKINAAEVAGLSDVIIVDI
jgi:hypothetical protein